MNKPKPFHKWIATFFLTIFVPTLLPIDALYAANNGPNAPEAASFEPVDATDMVSLATGDMAYVLPLLNVPSPEGGYPISLAYHGGIGYDQESSWVGLGWNLNPGAINRNVNGYPDDWKGAKVSDTEKFSWQGESVDVSAGYGRFDASIGYSWDSNGTKRGSVAIGASVYKSGNTQVGIGVGAAYSNKSGWSGSVTAQVGTKDGFGVGAYADTDGLIGVGAGHSAKIGSEKGGATMSTIGISLTSNKGQVGVGLSGGGNNLLNSQSGSSSTSSVGYSAGMYLYGFFIKLGYQKSTYSRNKNDVNTVYGPLYYSELPNSSGTQTSGISYPGSIQREHDRDVFMDAYLQPIPEMTSGVVAYNNVFDSQKFSYNAPSYDTYEVNAQGLSGRMSPRLVDNGLIINQGLDIEYEESRNGETCVRRCPGREALLDCLCNECHGQLIRNKRIYVNSHYSIDPNHKFKNSFGMMTGSGLNFYFDYQFPADLRVTPSTLQNYSNSSTLENYFVPNNSTITTRAENSDYIETFTNSQIVTGQTNGQFLEAKGYNRAQDQGYRGHGIGGYRVTTADGKTYHYSRPVYQFEQVYRQMTPKYNEDGSANGTYSEHDGHYREVRKTEPYATHWLLTAITGPDYVKMSNNSYPDEGDYGYWVRFDYGNWSDGYTWKTPFEGYDNVSVNSSSVANEYSWGRKQLVYLDKVVTRTHTALFVKSIRKDDIGKDIGNGGYPSNSGDGTVSYLSQKTLKLDEIILLKNSEYNNTVESHTQINALTSEPTSHTAQWNAETLGNITYALNQQLKVIDRGDFAINPGTGKLAIYDKALKTIKLNQNYELAQQSPNSTDVNKGRLTLNSVEVLGKGGESFMPSYTFEYIGKDVNYQQCTSTTNCMRDDWGYYKNDPSLWTLNKITMPTGGAIEFDYENDSYYTEAFSRRLFDEDNLKFRIYTDGQGENVVEYQKNSYWPDAIDFRDFFEANELTWGSLNCCHSEPDTMFEHGDRDWLGYNGQVPLAIKSVTENNIILRIPSNASWDTFGQVTGWDFREKGGWRCYVGDGCVDGDPHSAWKFNFKLLANKIPGTGSGGGIRVAKISTVNELGERYSTVYDYNDPTKNRTSGITSYAPSKGRKYVAYRTEIPGPRVMYKYVTLTEKGSNNATLGKTQYEFDVLKPVLNIFDPNLQESEHFRATVSINTLDSSNSTYGVDVKLEDNFATIGNLVKVSQINKEGQLISQLKNNYLSLNELADYTTEKPGRLQESFHSMRSIYAWQKEYIEGNANIGVANWTETCELSQSISVNKRIATASSKITYPVVQKRKEEIVGNQKQVTEFKKIDPKTGLFLESHTTLANGTAIKTESVPAYTKYPVMGSKVSSPNNKHMLTQEAMSITSVQKPGAPWRTVNAGITAWNDTWAYRNEQFGTDNIDNVNKVWRKHKTFAWKENVSIDGAYTTTITSSNSQFDWSTNTPLSDKWQKLSEITRYNRWSSPLETKDINGNFASTKMADNNSKVLVSGNARYTEMYYSGAEFVKTGNLFDGEVKGAQFRTEIAAHTGEYAVKATSLTDNVFEVNGSSGGTDYYTNAASYTSTFRPGKYKVSFWVYKAENEQGMLPVPVESNGMLLVNDVQIPVSEIVNAGCWQQMNFYFDIPANNQNNTIAIRAQQITGTDFFDDFRMHPVASSISGFVYDLKTDELVATLDGNNLGSVFKYDKAGRMVAKYAEVIDEPALDGGFKILSQHKQNYRGITTQTVNYPPTIDNCYHEIIPMSVSVTSECLGTFRNKMKVNVTNGSGNYEYQYKWKTDFENGVYSDYVFGGDTYMVPYVPHFTVPSTYLGPYAQRWDLMVKVRDLVTNSTVEVAYVYELPVDEDKNLFGETRIEWGRCLPNCSADSKLVKIHLKDIGDQGNFVYEYVYNYEFNDSLDPDAEWIEAINGEFCPNQLRYPTSNCSSGFATIFSIHIRVRNLDDNAIYYSGTGWIIGECTDNMDLPLFGTDPSGKMEFNELKAGTVIIKDSKGRIIEHYNEVVK